MEKSRLPGQYPRLRLQTTSNRLPAQDQHIYLFKKQTKDIIAKLAGQNNTT